jgi:hypothetical protein
VPPDDGDRVAAADPVGDRRLEALPDERHLQVVAHPAVDGDERRGPRLTVVTV